MNAKRSDLQVNLLVIGVLCVFNANLIYLKNDVHILFEYFGRYKLLKIADNSFKPLTTFGAGTSIVCFDEIQISRD